MSAFVVWAMLAMGLSQAGAPAPASPPGDPPAAPAAAAQQFHAMDRNNDGLVSSGEFEDVARAMFDAMDADGDGSVTLAEMEAARQRLDARAPRLSPGAAARKIRELDTNNDGVLSDTEHRAGATRLFRDADGDNDGNLTTQEFDARYAELVASLAA